MEIKIVYENNKERFDYILEKAARIYLTQLCPSILDKDIKIHISVDNNIKVKEHRGYVEFGYQLGTDDEADFYIKVRKSLDIFTQLRTLAHECVHVKQFFCNELVVGDKTFYWKEYLYPKDFPYFDRPWEIEAIERAKVLSDAFISDEVSDARIKALGEVLKHLKAKKKIAVA